MSTDSKKKMILILTSDEQSLEVATTLKTLLQTSDNRVIVISDKQYRSKLEYCYIGNKIDRGKYYSKEISFIEKKKLLKFFTHRTIKRISNAIYRYEPDLIITLTPFAHYIAIRAKQDFKNEVTIVDYIFRFTLEDRIYNDFVTNKFIVENSTMREQLIKMGVKNKNIANLGFPFKLKKLSNEEIEDIKKKNGIPDTPMICIDIKDQKSVTEIFNMIVDQGKKFNIVINTHNNKFLDSLYRKVAGMNINVIFTADRNEFDTYLSFANFLVTDFNVVNIYKAFSVDVPIIAVGHESDDINNLKQLEESGLILLATENTKVISYLYDMFQTDIKDKLIKNVDEKMQYISDENIKSYLLSIGDE